MSQRGSPPLARQSAVVIIPGMREDNGTHCEVTSSSPERLGRTSLAERYLRAKTALAQADPFYTSEGFWRGFESGPVDEAQVAKLEEMARNYQRQGTRQPEPQAPGTTGPIDSLLDRYDTGEIETVRDLADEAEALAVETDDEPLMDAVQAFRRFQREDWALAGRGDWDEAEANLIAGIKRARSA
jgi:hypothetical protein